MFKKYPEVGLGLQPAFNPAHHSNLQKVTFSPFQKKVVNRKLIQNDGILMAILRQQNQPKNYSNQRNHSIPIDSRATLNASHKEKNVTLQN